ncbi:glycosyltransferase family 2 protein [Leucobacter sp. USHLN153]|uniref:glycosyltransferase family 2 protein n=1 Tax=Leucobacter sp. USHLN153 TaxID=3081268 RepID=UPI003018411D
MWPGEATQSGGFETRGGERVSVVIPHFNDSSSLERAVESALAQTVAPHEIIVVDDASEPAHLDRARCLLRGVPGARLIERPSNSGPARCRNVGWEAATGELVAFLDSDDVWQREKTERQLQLLRERPELIAVSGAYGRLQTGEAMADLPARAAHRDVPTSHLLIRNSMATPTVLVRARARSRFPERVRFAEDHHLWLELSREGAIAWVEAPVAAGFKRPVGESGLSGHVWRMLASEFSIFERLRRAGVLTARQTMFAWAVLTLRGSRRLAKHYAHRATRAISKLRIPAPALPPAPQTARSARKRAPETDKR